MTDRGRLSLRCFPPSPAFSRARALARKPAILEWAEDCKIDEDDDEDDDGRSEFTEPEVTKEHVAGLLAAAQPMLTWLQEAEEED